MKEILINVWFLMLALVVLLLKAAAWLVLGPIILCVRLYEMIRYEAQRLRHPPPSGGVFGAMARDLKERKREMKS
ncbi:MAG TPA: hypothetical protein PLE92_04635 [Lentisphaeria bacterium]|jgi:hypothetical protein|nr:hypothetical protein [Lentisphaerota bacterium]OQC15869.1 MAG: hypothetical protein BWX73_01137 [Lentisphaerae bacterium ADurb.Bin082]HQC52396.1 hypothetical protein [Lentisphaeria bacterium]HQL88134.1 hypothetical protein [Lentisphaeria bacterium]